VLIDPSFVFFLVNIPFSVKTENIEREENWHIPKITREKAVYGCSVLKHLFFNDLENVDQTW